MEVITQIQKLMKEQTDTFEKELKDVKKEMKEIQNNLDLAEAGEEEEANLSCKLLEENKKLKEENKNIIRVLGLIRADNKELKEYNEELKNENKKFYLASEELKEKADAENTANMIDKLNKEYELLSETNMKLEKERQSLSKQIGIWKEAHDEAVSTAIHYWSGGMHAECFASEVIPDQYRDEDGDCIAHYSDLDEWNYCYGKVEEYDDNSEQEQLRFHISGGGDPNTPNGYEDWIVKTDGTVWISHGSRPEQNHLQQGKNVIMCPEQRYISIQSADDGDYVLKMGEMIVELG